jgi:hypothetical protein
LLLGGLLALAACAATSGATRKYPPRRPGCALAVFYTATPGVPVWDDIGVAQVGCFIDEGEVACLHRLRVEACRMGGDILYNMPRRASRPKEREMMVRAQVAHTKPAPPDKHEEPAPASASAPVVPIAAPAPFPDGAVGDGSAGD